MGRPKSKSIPPEQKALESTPPEAKEAVSKAEAVRRALGQGIESPGAIAEFILENFGITMENQVISSYKSQEKTRDAKRAEAAPAKRGPKPKVASESVAIPAAKKPTANGDASLLSAMEAIKPLVDGLGKDQLHRIIELLG